METANVLQIFHDDHILENVKSICNDGDNHSQKVYQEKKMRHLIAHDPNHFRKSFQKALKKNVDDYATFCYINIDKERVTVEKPFEEIAEHLLHWMNTCLRESNRDRRIALWTSCTSHFLGDHSNC